MEIQIVQSEESGMWEVYIDGSPKGEFETEREAIAFADARLAGK